MRKRWIALLLCVSMLLPMAGRYDFFAYAEETEFSDAATETTSGETVGSETEAPTQTADTEPAETVAEQLTETTSGETTPVDYSAYIGKYATFQLEELAYFDFSATAGGESLVFTAEEIPADLTVVIKQWYADELGGIWYQIEAAPGYTLPEEIAQNPWVLDGYEGDILWSLKKFDAPEAEFVPTDINQATGLGITVGVSGMLPQGIRLSVEDAAVNPAGGTQPQDGSLAVNPADYGIADASAIVAALDIQLMNADGTPYQPETDGKEVMLTIDAAKLGLSDGDVVRLHHNHEGTITVHEPYVVIGGKLYFWTDQFSIYLVEAIRVENYSHEIAENSTYTIQIGEKAVFWADFGGSTAVWRVENPEFAIDYHVIGKFDPGNGYASRWAQWVEVKGLKEGQATISLVRNAGGIQTHTVTIQVVAPTGLVVQDNIAENGCLIPVWSEDSTVDLSRVKYTWSRNDGQAVRLEALKYDGGINISIDRGGATNLADGTVKTITYTVTATDLDGIKLAEASYEVLYGNEILNPSFEKPGGFGSGHSTFYNGYPGLFWKTTAPGTGGFLAQDIEVGYSTSNPYGIKRAAHGDYFVELNAEEFGALYQDMLTTPGAKLTWSFSHAKRQSSYGTYDKMYVIVAATDYARHIITKDNIDALLDAAMSQSNNGADIPDNDSPAYSEGFPFTFQDADGQICHYRIWHSRVAYSSNESEQWKTISGTYRVPEGQYLTRLFFAADTNDPNSANSTLGNMIDATKAGEFMNYIVEYYKADKLQEADTETGINESAYEQVALENLQSYLNVYKYPFEILINGKPYPGTIKNLQTGLLLTDYGKKQGHAADSKYQDYDIVLKIVFQDPNIRVTKVVEIEGWDDLTLAERKDILDAGIRADFRLTNQADSSDIHTTSVTITQLTDDGKLTSAASFRTVSEADFNKIFVVSETYATPILNYAVTTTIDPGTTGVTNSTGDRIKNVTVTNRYVRNVGNLTIKKDVVSPDGYTAPKDDVFTFLVSGPAVTRDSYLVSINNQPAVDYPVTDGKLTITLKQGEWAVIRNLDLKEYRVVEVEKDHYILTGVTGNTGTIVKENSAYAGFQNTYAPTGSLKVHKLVDVGTSQNVEIDQEQLFSFTLKLSNAPDVMHGPYPYTIRNHADDAVVSAGTLALNGSNQLSFQLKHDQYILIEDLPQSPYVLTEASAGSGYTQPYYYIGGDSQTGSCSSAIPKGGTEAVECYNPVDVANGDLQITKRVACDNPHAVIPKQPFRFTVVLRNAFLSDPVFQVEYACSDPTRGILSGNTYQLVGDDEVHTLPATVTAEEDLGEYIFTLELYDGLTATVKNIPPCGYSVSEDNYSADKFATGWIGSQTGFLGGMKVDGKNPVVSLVCVNTYDITTGQLNITKTVNKKYHRDIVPGTEFVFTVAPAADSGIALEDGEYLVMIGETAETAIAADNKLVVKIAFTDAELRDLELNDSKSKMLSIQGLPFGDYTVTETEDKDYDQSTRIQTAEVGSTAVDVGFTNTYRQHLGEITIHKYVTGTSDTDPVFVTITGGAVEMTVSVTPGIPVVIYDLPLDVSYTVTELTSWNWRYQAEGATVQTVKPTMENPKHSVSFYNTYEDDSWLSGTDVEANTFTKSTD